jgi:hypothetical protein
MKFPKVSFSKQSMTFLIVVIVLFILLILFWKFILNKKPTVMSMEGMEPIEKKPVKEGNTNMRKPAATK